MFTITFYYTERFANSPLTFSTVIELKNLQKLDRIFKKVLDIKLYLYEELNGVKKNTIPQKN